MRPAVKPQRDPYGGDAFASVDFDVEPKVVTPQQLLPQQGQGQMDDQNSAEPKKKGFFGFGGGKKKDKTPPAVPDRNGGGGMNDMMNMMDGGNDMMGMGMGNMNQMQFEPGPAPGLPGLPARPGNNNTMNNFMGPGPMTAGPNFGNGSSNNNLGAGVADVFAEDNESSGSESEEDEADESPKRPLPGLPAKGNAMGMPALPNKNMMPMISNNNMPQFNKAPATFQPNISYNAMENMNGMGNMNGMNGMGNMNGNNNMNGGGMNGFGGQDDMMMQGQMGGGMQGLMNNGEGDGASETKPKGGRLNLVKNVTGLFGSAKKMLPGGKKGDAAEASQMMGDMGDAMADASSNAAEPKKKMGFLGKLGFGKKKKDADEPQIPPTFDAPMLDNFQPNLASDSKNISFGGAGAMAPGVGQRPGGGPGSLAEFVSKMPDVPATQMDSEEEEDDSEDEQPKKLPALPTRNKTPPKQAGAAAFNPMSALPNPFGGGPPAMSAIPNPFAGGPPPNFGAPQSFGNPSSQVNTFSPPQPVPKFSNADIQDILAPMGKDSPMSQEKPAPVNSNGPSPYAKPKPGAAAQGVGGQMAMLPVDLSAKGESKSLFDPTTNNLNLPGGNPMSPGPAAVNGEKKKKKKGKKRRKDANGNPVEGANGQPGAKHKHHRKKKEGGETAAAAGASDPNAQSAKQHVKKKKSSNVVVKPADESMPEIGRERKESLGMPYGMNNMNLPVTTEAPKMLFSTRIKRGDSNLPTNAKDSSPGSPTDVLSSAKKKMDMDSEPKTLKLPVKSPAPAKPKMQMEKSGSKASGGGALSPSEKLEKIEKSIAGIQVSINNPNTSEAQKEQLKMALAKLEVKRTSVMIKASEALLQELDM